MNEMIIGTSALDSADVSLIKAAGIGWVRKDFPFPFTDRMEGSLTEAYTQAKNKARDWKSKGLSIMGVTPLPGLGVNEPDAKGNLRLVWHTWLPEWFGVPGSDQYLRNYRQLGVFLAKDLKGIVSMWQVCNELDIEIFAGPLDLRQACVLITSGARGLKETDPSLIVGSNSVYFEKSYYLYGRLFAGPDACLDYCGVDSYFGSWRSGGPENWAACISELSRITGAKVLVNEWGFASGGAVMSRPEKDLADAGTPPCQFRKWPFGWRQGHSLELQADFVREIFKVFQKHRDKLMGAFVYRWDDQEKCWQCGKPDCPLETAWGLVDRNNRPKPAYEAFKEGVKLLRS